jgi:hypothetical protein
MDEKFYYSRKHIKEFVSSNFPYVLFQALLTPVILEVSPIWFSIVWLIFLAGFIFGIAHSFDNMDAPAIVIVDQKIAVRSLYFGKREIGFAQIISAAIIREKIKLKYKKANNKEGSFSIAYVREIDDSERLVDVLKQRIKFV